MKTVGYATTAVAIALSITLSLLAQRMNLYLQLMINKIDEAIENNKYLKYYFVIKIRGIEI